MSIPATPRRRLTRAAALLAATTLACITMAHAGNHDPAGVGDEYFPQAGNGGYDVAEYKIDVEYLPESKSIAGSTRIQARAQVALDLFHLDFKQQVSSVRVNNQDATFTTEGDHELVITPAETLAADKLFWVEVEYAGSMDFSNDDQADPGYYSGVGLTDDGGVVAVGQPFSAWWWYPSNDHPRDKATFDINLTAPEEFISISNGQKKHETRESGKRTYRWVEDKPMASYLAFMAIGKFDMNHEWRTSGESWTAIATEGVDEDVQQNAREALYQLPGIQQWATEQFGPYPFSSSGSVMPASNFQFALENQSRPVYSTMWFQGGADTGVVVHETAHQWFGNSVSVDTWRDIWLNEGFATWAQWKYLEDQGELPANKSFEDWYRRIDADKPMLPNFWNVTVGDPGKKDVFNYAVYFRGAMAVQALRNKIGDDDHKRLLQAWTAKHAYSNAKVPEFIALAEEISGEDLDEFFNVWLFTPGKPAPTVENGIPDESWGDPLPEEEAAAAQARVDRAIELHPHAGKRAVGVTAEDVSTR